MAPTSADRTAGDRNLPGRASFVAPDELRVALADGGEERIRADAVVVATGSSPIVPAPWRAFGERILTTDTLFEQPSCPDDGGGGLGAIGLELGQALARLGLEVTGFELRDAVAASPIPPAEAAKKRLGGVPAALGHGVEIDPPARPCGWWPANAPPPSTRPRRAGSRPQPGGLGLDRLGLPLDERGLPPFNPHTMQVGDLPSTSPGTSTPTGW